MSEILTSTWNVKESRAKSGLSLVNKISDDMLDNESQHQLQQLKTQKDQQLDSENQKSKTEISRLMKEFFTGLSNEEFIHTGITLFGNKSVVENTQAGSMYNIWLQQLVVRAGGSHLLEKGGVDSFIGLSSFDAVKQLQPLIGTRGDGKFGKNSFEALKNFWNNSSNKATFATLLANSIPKATATPKASNTPKKEAETRNNSEIEKGYTLSKKDFIRYFKNRDFIQNQGNCWLTSAIAGIMKRPDWERLIRSSCSITKDIHGLEVFNFKIPLGEPQAKSYAISSSLATSRQIVDNAFTPSSPLIDAIPNPGMAPFAKSRGIILLELAYLAKSTGSTTVDLSQLEGLSISNSGNQYLDLLGEENISIETKNNSDQDFKSLLMSTLQKFDCSNQIISLGINGSYQSGGLINHEVVVDSISNNNGNIVINIFDPNFGEKNLKTISLQELQDICGDFTLVKKKGSYQNSSSNNNVNKVYDQRSSKSIAIQNIERKIGRQGEKYNDYLRYNRGNIILESHNTSMLGSDYVNGVSIKSYGINSTQIKYSLSDYKQGSNMNIAFQNTIQNKISLGEINGFTLIHTSNQSTVGQIECQLDKDAFLSPDIGSIKKEDEIIIERSIKYMDYYRKLGNFINFVKFEYINKGKGDGLRPFALKNNSIVFDDDITKNPRSVKKYGMTISGKSLDYLHDKVNVLENWEGMGIHKKQDKQKIVDFLNNIYETEHKPQSTFAFTPEM